MDGSQGSGEIRVSSLKRLGRIEEHMQIQRIVNSGLRTSERVGKKV